MRVIEGKGFLLRHSPDSPFSGWITAQQLDAQAPIQAAPWLALQTLSELARLLPGGLSLLWDLPRPSLSGLPHAVRAAFWNALGHLPGLTLHLRDEAFSEHLEGPLHGWFHSPQPPTGPMGLAWRQGWIGWIPEPDSGWSIPGLGKAEYPSEETGSGCQWGEVLLPLGALGEVTAAELAPLLEDVQAGIERNFSLRMSVHAWPSALPFQRRRTGWRLAVLGGREYTLAAGTWENAAAKLRQLVKELSERLRSPILLGSSHDPEGASLLGHQAMREGHPWRYSLPIPPASPTFTPGLATDPREASPLESRAAFPSVLAPLLTHPPVALLRLPCLPQEASVMAFLQGLQSIPAIRWIPPEIPPPGPFSQERPWPPASAFMPLADVTQALQPSLFADLDQDQAGVD